jgi:hypothetical protein
MRILIFMLLTWGAALGQDVTRNFAIQNANATGVQEIATTLRTVVDIRNLSVGNSPAQVSITTSPDLAAVAEFLIPKLDQKAADRQSPTIETYPMGNGDSIVVYGLTNATSPAGIMEILASLRVILDVQHIYMVTTPRLLIMCGNATMIQEAEWLLPKLDTPAPVAGTDLQIGQDDLVRVFYLPPATDLGSLSKQVRQATKLRKVFQRSAPPALIVRSSSGQMAAAAQLISPYMNR